MQTIDLKYVIININQPRLRNTTPEQLFLLPALIMSGTLSLHA